MQVASKKPSESPRAQTARLEGLARGAKGGVGSEAAAKPAAPGVPTLDGALSHSTNPGGDRAPARVARD